MNTGELRSSGIDSLRNLANIHRSGVIGNPVQHDAATQKKTGAEEKTFSEVLKSKTEGVKFSSHASSRLRSRNIEMTPDIMSKLEKAVEGAANKGARDSLILMKDLAFIVNIPNKTVVTAMDGESIRDNVFTNIDSTVIAG